jgi:hypothetical protein
VVGGAKLGPVATEPCFVLVHSPFAGPSTWREVADSLRGRGHDVIVPALSGFERGGAPYWEACVAMVVDACRGPHRPLALVGHSAAGPLLPALTRALAGTVGHVVFADAVMAPVAGAAELAPVWMWNRASPLASGGVLPKWSRWWSPGTMATLVPDESRRREIEDEMPELPLDYLEQVLRVPEHWTRQVGCSYVWFSDAHRDDAGSAAHRSWPVRRVAGGHLHMVVEPEAVADVLVALCGRS